MSPQELIRRKNSGLYIATALLSGRRNMGLTKIVYFINGLDTGGAEVGMCRLFEGLDDNLYDITVVSLSGTNREFAKRLPENVSVVDLKDDGLRKGFSLVQSLINADIIVGSLFHSVLTARLAGILNRRATVATWQNSEGFKTDLRRYLIGATNSLSDVVLADSEPVAEMYRNEFKIKEEYVKTVPIAGVPLDQFEPYEHQSKETIVVGSVGRLAPPKNYRTLIDIAAEFSNENIQFRIAGDGPKKLELQSMIEEKNLKNIELIGEIRDVPGFLSSVDIYVQPSRWEGLCMTVIEAMAAGLPVIASPVGGIEHNVADGENGYLHQPDDIDGFCESIQELASNPSMRQEFGNRGRKIVKENYTQEVLVSRFKEAIDESSR